MVGLKSGPQLVIDHMIMYQLLTADDFWEALPTGFEDLRAVGAEAGKKALQVAMGKTCAGCSSIRSVIADFHNKFWGRVGTALGETQLLTKYALEPLFNLIATKRGYRPLPIIVYYVADGGGTARLRL